jgi:hypothetical protein
VSAYGATQLRPHLEAARTAGSRIPDPLQPVAADPHDHQFPAVSVESRSRADRWHGVSRGRDEGVRPRREGTDARRGTPAARMGNQLALCGSRCRRCSRDSYLLQRQHRRAERRHARAPQHPCECRCRRADLRSDGQRCDGGGVAVLSLVRVHRNHLAAGRRRLWRRLPREPDGREKRLASWRPGIARR